MAKLFPMVDRRSLLYKELQQPKSFVQSLGSTFVFVSFSSSFFTSLVRDYSSNFQVRFSLAMSLFVYEVPISFFIDYQAFRFLFVFQAFRL